MGAMVSEAEKRGEAALELVLSMNELIVLNESISFSLASLKQIPGADIRKLVRVQARIEGAIRGARS